MDFSSYKDAPHVRVNLVQGPNGALTDSDGSSRGISNPLDKELLLALRGFCDVLVTDGETARREQYKVPLNADLAVITRIGYTPAAGTSKHRYVRLTADLSESVAELRRGGYEHLLLEVGPGLLREHWVSIDELCLTNTGNSSPDLASLGIAQATLVSEEINGDTRFTRWTQIQGI